MLHSSHLAKLPNKAYMEEITNLLGTIRKNHSTETELNIKKRTARAIPHIRNLEGTCSLDYTLLYQT